MVYSLLLLLQLMFVYALVFCRMPEIKNVSMIECEKCLGWFHTSCETVDEEVLDKSGYVIHVTPRAHAQRGVK